MEARDADGAFYPLEQRIARWPRCSPDTLIEHVQRDLLAYADGALRDDAAILAVRRTAAVGATS
ncbi:hypothetical protein RKD49_000249 [Streptomyces glaucescens]